MQRLWGVVLVGLCLVSCGVESNKIRVSSSQSPNVVLRINHLQSKGTHNSYHVEPWPALLPAWRYTHSTLRIQLGEQNVRQLEFDVHYQPATHDFRVMHIRQMDAETTCGTLRTCLEDIKQWSDEHPYHQTLFVMLEPKGDLPTQYATYFADLENEILTVWPRQRLMLPENVQGDYPSLPAAVVDRGWPTVDEGRGKVAFVLLNWDVFRRYYTYNETSLEGRILFATADVDSPYAAMLSLDDPLLQGDLIRRTVQAGFIVRTRADADNVEPYAGDQRRLTAALQNGAQLISTDYPSPIEGVDYWVDIPSGAPSRCNPVTAPLGCVLRGFNFNY